MTRPSSIALGVLVASCLSAAVAAAAAELRITAPSAPGGASDLLAQALKSALVDARGDTAVQVANVPGAGGTTGLVQFLAEGSDTGLLVTGLSMLDAAFVHRSPVSLDKMTAVARLSAEPFAIVVAANSPFKTLEDLRTAMLADLGRVTWASGPTGGIEHVAAALFAIGIGLDPARMNVVSFLTAAEAAAALPDGQISALAAPLGDLSGDLRSGRIRILAVTSTQRVAGLDAPTLTERGIPLDLSNWRGVVARPGLSPERRAELVGKVAALPGSRAWRDTLDRRGWQDAYLDGDAFASFIAREQFRIKTALRALNLLKRLPD